MIAIGKKHSANTRLLALVLLALAVYGKVITFDFVPYDDPAYVTQNGYVRDGLSADGIRWAFTGVESPGRQISHAGVTNLWHPLTWVSHMLDCSLFGVEDAAGHHGVNLILHLLASVLAMCVFSLIFKNDSERHPENHDKLRWAGLLMAALWMVHPLKAESVAWISERKDVLSGVFFWAAFWCGLGKGTEEAKQGGKAEAKGRARQLIGWGLFVCAIMSKPSAVILPPLLAMIHAYRQGERDWGLGFLIKALRNWWPWLATSLVAGIMAMLIQAGGSHQDFAENTPLLGRIIPMAWGFWFYLWRMVIPWNLTIDYPPPGFGLAGYFIAWGMLIPLAFLIWRKRRQWPLIWLAFVWFIICWLPISGIIYIGGTFSSDRYMYLALVGPLLPLVHWIMTRPRSPVFGLGLVALWSTLAFFQTATWRNGFTLFKHATLAQPNAALGWVNLGAYYQENRQWADARHSLAKALELDPNDYIAWCNLGQVMEKMERKAEALSAYEKSLKIYPEYTRAVVPLGLLLRSEGRVMEARDLFKKHSHRNEVILWYWCETELKMGNKAEGRKILQQLDQRPVKNPALLLEIKRAHEFLRDPVKGNH